MKIKILLIAIFMAGNIYCQEMDKPPMGPPNKKFEQLEQLKLLEILNLDEDTAVKFITRRNKNRDKIMDVMRDFDTELDKMEKLLNSDKKDKNYSDYIEKCISYEIKITEEKNNFIESLKDILTNEQIAKVIIFERKFRRDVRDILLEKGKKRIQRDREE